MGEFVFSIREGFVSVKPFLVAYKEKISDTEH